MKKERILIVEDDEAMREELIPILENSGYLVDAATNGQSAIVHLENNRYNLMLLDLKMPGINGYEVLKWTKKIHAQLRVIVLSGSPLRPETLQDKDQVFPDGTDYDQLVSQLADAFITKPFDVERLLTCMKDVLSGKRRVES